MKCLTLCLKKRSGFAPFFPTAIPSSISLFFPKANRWPLDLYRNPFISTWERTSPAVSNPSGLSQLFLLQLRTKICFVLFCFHGKKDLLAAADTTEIIWPWPWSLKLDQRFSWLSIFKCSNLSCPKLICPSISDVSMFAKAELFPISGWASRKEASENLWHFQKS